MEDSANALPESGGALLSAITTGDIDLLRQLLQTQLRSAGGQQDVVQPEGTAVPASETGVAEATVSEQTYPGQDCAAVGHSDLVADDVDMYFGCQTQRVRLLGHSHELHLATVRVMGKLIWPAAIAMAELLLREPDVVSAHQMRKQGALHSSCWLELGAGCGAVSLVAAGAARRASKPSPQAQMLARSAVVANSIDDEWAPRSLPEISMSSGRPSVTTVEQSLLGEPSPHAVENAPRLFTYVLATEMTEHASALLTSNSRRNGDENARIDHICTLDVLNGDNAILEALNGALSQGAHADRVCPSLDGIAADATSVNGTATGSAETEPRRRASILSQSKVVICACDMFYDQEVIRATMRSFAHVAKRQLEEAGSPHGSSSAADERELRGEARAKLVLARSSNFEHNDQYLISTSPKLGLRLAWERDEIVPAYMLEDLSIGPLLDDTVRIFCLELA